MKAEITINKNGIAEKFEIIDEEGKVLLNGDRVKSYQINHTADNKPEIIIVFETDDITFKAENIDVKVI